MANNLMFNPRLDFEDMSCDEEEDNVSEKSGATSSSTNHSSTLLRKKLNFDLADICDLDYHEDNEDEDEDVELDVTSKKKRRFNANTMKNHNNHDISETSLELTPNAVPSPCRTRSGRIFNHTSSSEKPKITSTKRIYRKKITTSNSSTENKENDISSGAIMPSPITPIATAHNINRIPTPVFNSIPMATTGTGNNQQATAKELHLLQKDVLPPPLNYIKRPVSRISHGVPNRLQSPSSPPTNEVEAMKLFDDHVITSPVTAPRLNPIRSRVFETDRDRRQSAPAPGNNLMAYNSGDNASERKRKRVTNINPFTPNYIMANLRKKARMTSGESSNNGSFETAPNIEPIVVEAFGISHEVQNEDEDHEEFFEDSPRKRLKVSDLNFPGVYEDQFVEIKEIASGSFGTVRIARHRLDGMIYAIKVTRHQIYGNTHQEKVAMNEVFAHAALMKHKHVVRYYNSWVENGRVYIQNEYCEGGSLASKIQELKNSGKYFTESELKRILLHLAKGLQYIHSKMLVHLDIKPENIFISLEHPVTSPIRTMSSNDGSDQVSTGASSSNLAASNVDASGEAVSSAAAMVKDPNVISTEEELFSGNESTDSGNHSGTNCRKPEGISGSRSGSVSSSPVDDRLSYKIGDLGHVAQIHGDPVPEEGDCRYMAPELLAMDINREWLTKADIFSLGLTLYAAASLKDLPKNSLEDPEYENIKAGQLPYLESYSKDFNALLKAMVNPDPLARPHASRLANLQSLRGTNSSNVKSRSQLYQELKETQRKLRMLEFELSSSRSAQAHHGGSSAVTQSAQDSPITSRNLRLIGKGCGRSRSSNVIGTSTLTPTRKW